MINRIVVFFILLRSLIASVSISDTRALAGTWEAQARLADLFNYAIAQEAGEFAGYISPDSLELTLVAEFTEEGTYHIYADREAAYAAYELLLPQIRDAALAYITDQVSAGGFGMDVEAFLSFSGIDVDKLIEEHLGPDMVEELLAMADSSGKFESRDGKIYLYDDAVDESCYLLYTLQGDTLTVTGGTAIGMIYGVADKYTSYLYPMVFDKAA